MTPLFVADCDAFHAVALFHGINYILTFQHTAEYRVFAIQVRLRGVGNEELRPIGIRASIGH